MTLSDTVKNLAHFFVDSFYHWSCTSSGRDMSRYRRDFHSLSTTYLSLAATSVSAEPRPGMCR